MQKASDYISRETAHALLCQFCIGAQICDHKDNCNVEKALANIPSADVAPVRHGEWIVSRTDRGWNCAEFPTHCKCSLCNMEISYSHKDNYCPNCGAKMKEGDNETD